MSPCAQLSRAVSYRQGMWGRRCGQEDGGWPTQRALRSVACAGTPCHQLLYTAHTAPKSWACETPSQHG